MRKFRFRDFNVYKDSLEFRSEIKKICVKYFPPSEKFILFDQIIRALNSIVLNIAEGADRGTDKDFALFLNRSHTSLNEVVACLDIALDDGYITSPVHNSSLLHAQDLANQLTAFRKKLVMHPTK